MIIAYVYKYKTSLKSKKKVCLSEFTTENDKYVWHCEKCQRCTFCGVWKEKVTKFKDDGAWHFGDVCYECEHPPCHSCGHRHVGKRALLGNNPGIKGTQFNKKWYCDKAACQEMCNNDWGANMLSPQATKNE